MAEIIWQCVGGLPIPSLPIAPDGTQRHIDGVRWLGVEHITQRFSIDEAAAHEAYAAFLQEVGYGLQGERSRAIAHQLLRERFRHLSDQHFDEYLECCRQRSFNPWGRHLWADTRWNDKTQREELYVQLTADGFFATALRTGELDCIVGPQWCGQDGVWLDVWPHDTPPVAARTGVQRRGMTAPLFMVARWRSYAPANPDEFWTTKGDFMLGKCASCLALRRTFAEFLDGIYAPEEMAATRHRRHKPDDEPPPVDPGDAPQTPRQLHLALLDLGIRDPRQRDQVIEQFRQRLPLLYARNVAGFYGEVVRAVRKNPAEYAREMVEAG